MPDPFTTTLDVPVAGGRLRLALAGPPSGPIVLAVHDLAGSHADWAEVAERLAGDVALLAPDLRGRGDSAGLPGPFGVSAHVEDLVAVLDHAGAVGATVVGHGLGAVVAARLAAMRPERASAVVLVDPVLPEPGHDPPDAPGADAEAVVADWQDLRGDEPVRQAVRNLGCPAVLVRTAPGPGPQRPGALDDEAAEALVAQVPGLVEVVVAGAALRGEGAATVADRVRASAGVA